MNAHHLRAIGLLGIGGFLAPTLSAQECEINGAIPCVVRWHQLTEVPGREHSAGRAVRQITGGDILTGANSEGSGYLDRLVLKFKADGTPVYQLNIPGLPWYIGGSSSGDYLDIAWHRIVLDEARGRFYVLFAAMPSPPTGQYGYYLTAHDLADGKKTATWNYGLSQYVGSSTALSAGVDFDANGDVWTVIQWSGVSGTLQAKKWSKNDGTVITPAPNVTGGDYMLIASPTSVFRRFQAFGIRKTDSKMFLAFEESPHNAVISVWSSTFGFLSRLDYAKVLPAPASIPSTDGCCGVYEETTHPYFSDGFVDGQGRFLLAGTYRYLRPYGEFNEFFTFPALLRYDLDAAGTNAVSSFEYYEATNPALQGGYLTAPSDVRAIGDATGRTFLQLKPIGVTVYLVSAAGQYADHIRYLPMPFTGTQGTSPCTYWNIADAPDFSYLDNRLILVGTVTTVFNPCAETDSVAFTISYGRTFLPKCCIQLGPFPWDFDRFAWFFEDFKRPFPPPDPDPCPICGKRATLSPTLLRALELTTSRRITAEFPGRERQRLADGLRNVRAGAFFDDSTRSRLVAALTDTAKRGGISEETRNLLLRSVNGMLLDERVSRRVEKAVQAKDSRRAVTAGRVSIRLPAVAQSGSVSVEVRNEIPGAVQGMEPVLPLATYRVRASGLGQSQEAEISFDIRDFAVPAGTTELHVLAWDGKAYRDVTSAFDLTAGLVRAKAPAAGDFVLMAAPPTMISEKQ